MESLPREIVIHIAKQIPPRDINALLRTNRAFSVLLSATLRDSAVDRNLPDVAQRALHAFASRGDDESVSRLLDHGILDIIGLDRALHEAIEEGPESMVCNLWRNGAKVITRGDQERTPVMIAAKQGYTEAVRMMMEEGIFDINEQDQWLRTALYTAVCEGNESTVEILISHPAIDPNMTDQFGDTPLHVAAECGWSGITGLLLSHRWTLVNAKDARDMAPLHIAVILDHVDVVNLLLKDPRLNINEHGQHQQTALHMAALQGQTQMVHTLLQHPDIDITVSNGPVRWGRGVFGATTIDDWARTPLLPAAVQGHTDNVILDAVNAERSHMDRANLLNNPPLHRAAYHYSSVLLFLTPRSVNISAHGDTSVRSLALQLEYAAEVNQAVIEYMRDRLCARVKREPDTPVQTRPKKRSRQGKARSE